MTGLELCLYTGHKVARRCNLESQILHAGQRYPHNKMIQVMFLCDVLCIWSEVCMIKLPEFKMEYSVFGALADRQLLVKLKHGIFVWPIMGLASFQRKLNYFVLNIPLLTDGKTNVYRCISLRANNNYPQVEAKKASNFC